MIEFGFLNLALFNQPVNGLETQKLETQEFYEGDLSLYTDFFIREDGTGICAGSFWTENLKSTRPSRRSCEETRPIFTSNHAPFFVMEKGPETFRDDKLEE